MKKQMSLLTVTSCLVVTASFVPTAALGDFDGVEAPDRFKDVPIEETPWDADSPAKEIPSELIEPSLDEMVLEVPGEYPTIQAAISAAKNGDIIQLAAGKYGSFIHDSGIHLTIRGPHHSMGAAVPEPAVIGRMGAPELEGPGIVVGSRSSLSLQNIFVAGWRSPRGRGYQSASGLMLEGDSSLRASRCVFAMNLCDELDPVYWRDTRGRGGAVMMTEGSTAKFETCLFYENSADDAGGAICCDMRSGEGGMLHVSDCTFSMNQAGGSGGAICMTNGEVEPPESRRWEWHFPNEANLRVESCRFSSNRSMHTGGAISINAGTSLITDCSFTRNNAYVAGAIASYGPSSVALDECNFQFNESHHGGAIKYGNVYYSKVPLRVGEAGLVLSWKLRFRQQEQSLSITRSEFLDNTAVHDGGAIDALTRGMTVFDCQFRRNVSSEGSAINVVAPFGDRDPLPRIEGSMFCSNWGSQDVFFSNGAHAGYYRWRDRGWELELASAGNCIQETCSMGPGCNHPCDVDADGDVDIDDLMQVFTAWSRYGGEACGDCPEDVNGDGVVDMLDYMEVLDEYLLRL